MNRNIDDLIPVLDVVGLPMLQNISVRCFHSYPFLSVTMSDPIDLHVLTATEMYPKYIECSVKNTQEFTINHKTALIKPYH